MVIINFRAVEEGRPKVYFYKVISVGPNTAATDYLHALVQSFEDDDEKFQKQGINLHLKDYIKTHLFSVGTDGANVMTGKHNGLVALLNKWTGRTIFSVWCMAHRLELSTKWAWKKSTKDPFGVIALEFMIERISKYFYFSYKRTGQLIEFAEMLMVEYSPLSNLQKTRWLEGDFRAVVKYLKDWRALEMFLDSVEQKAEPEAVFLYDLIVNKNQLLLMHFLGDVLPILSSLSKQFQLQEGVLFDKSHSVKQCIKALEEAKTKDHVGKYMTVFLNEALCFDQEQRATQNGSWTTVFVSGEPCQTQDRYNEAAQVTYKDVALREKGRQTRPGTKKYYNFPVLKTIQGSMIQALIDQMKVYFPLPGRVANATEAARQKRFIFLGMDYPMEPLDLHHITLFDFLSPNNFPQSEFAILDYGVSNITRLCADFVQCTGSLSAVLEEWSALLIFIMRAPSYHELKNSGAITLWHYFLTKPLNCPWTQTMTNIVKAGLSVPHASADIERGFSLYNTLKTDRRSKLNQESLNTFLRIRFNGPDPEKFGAYKMAKLWVGTGHLRTDAPKAEKVREEEVPSKAELLQIEYPEFEELKQQENERQIMQTKSNLFK